MQGKNIDSGYKGLDGKTYKSFLEYRKNSEKQLKILTSAGRIKDSSILHSR